MSGPVSPSLVARRSSHLKLAIEDALDAGLPRAYTLEIYKQKCSAVFEHVYESYPEQDVGVYAAAATGGTTPP
jgi:type I restriction enzyme R subunit